MMKKKRKPFSLYRRSGVYYVRLWDEERSEYTTARTTGETDRDRAILKAGEMMKTGRIVRKDQDPLFTDFLREYWQQRNDLTPRYKENALSCVRIVAAFPGLQGLRMSTIKAGHVNRFIDHLKAKGTSPRTIERIVQHIKTFIRWADSRDYIPADFSRKIERFKKKQRRRGFLTPEEIFLLAAVVWPDARMKAAVMLGAFGGLRRGEIRALRWKDLDRENGYIHIRQNFTDDYDDQGEPIFKEPKAGSSGKVPALIFPEVQRALKAVWDETPHKKPDDLVLTNVWETSRRNAATPGGRLPMAESTIKREFPRMLEAIGISTAEQKERNIVFHGLRHSYASLMSSLLPGNLTRALTRHQSQSMLENYEHVLENSVLDGVKAVNLALEKYRVKQIQ